MWIAKKIITPSNAILVIAAVIWWFIAFYTSFGDEQENFTASWLITQGLVPYRDFFFHHAPLPFFIGAPGYLFSATPWIYFRLVIFLWWLLCGFVTAQLVHERLRLVTACSWVIIALSAPYFQLNLFLAESFVLPAVSSFLLLLFSHWFYENKLYFKPLLFWVIASWVAIWSTVVAIPPIGWVVVGVLLGKKSSKTVATTLLKKNGMILTILLVVLHGFFIVYFLFLKSLNQAWWSIITYNFEYYFPLRLAGDSARAKEGYGLTVIQSFWLSAVKDWSLIIDSSLIAIQTVAGLVSFAVIGGEVATGQLWVLWSEWAQRVITVESLTTIMGAGVLLWLLICRRWLVAGWWVVWLVTLRGRENEIFKLSTYYLPIVTGWLFVTITTWQQRMKTKAIIFGLLIVAWVSVMVPTYTQVLRLKQPIIPVATVNVAEELKMSISVNSSTIYVLGGNPVYYLLAKKFPAHPYFYYHPWFHEAPPMQTAVQTFLTENTAFPVVLASELDGSSLEYASELEDLVRAQYASTSAGVYLPNTIDGLVIQ